MLRIRSEHAIGYLKGRFHSLKGLRVLIDSPDAHIIATYWVAACIGIHAFALRHETEERRQEDPDYDEFEPPHDPFIDEGLTDSDDDARGMHGVEPASTTARVPARLRRGRARREQLKRRLFRAKERAAERRRMSRYTDVMAEFSSSDSDDSESE